MISTAERIPAPQPNGETRPPSLFPGDLVKTRTNRWLFVTAIDANGMIATRGTDGRAVYLPKSAWIEPFTEQKFKLKIIAEILRRVAFHERDTIEQYDRRRREIVAMLGLPATTEWASITFDLARRLTHLRSPHLRLRRHAVPHLSR
jgi:hypothetical protein